MFKNRQKPHRIIGIMILSIGLPFLGIFIDEYLSNFSINKLLKQWELMVLVCLFTTLIICGCLTFAGLKFMRQTLIILGHLFLAAWILLLYFSSTKMGFSERDFIRSFLPLSISLLSVILPGILLLSNTGIKESFGVQRNSQLNFYNNNYPLSTILGVTLTGMPLGLLALALQQILRMPSNIKFNELIFLSICGLAVIAGLSLISRIPKHIQISNILLALILFFFLVFMIDIIPGSRDVWINTGFGLFGILLGISIALLLNNSFLKEQFEIAENRKEDFDDILDV